MATEDFTTYSIRPDPLVLTTVTAPKVSWAALAGSDDELVYDDKGADHFGADFEHLCEVYIDTTNNNAYHGTWSLADYVDDYGGLDSASKDLFTCYIGEFADANFIQMREIVAGTLYASAAYAFAEDTLYHLKIKRNSGVGTYGTLYCYIYEDDGGSPGDLLDTLSITLQNPTGYENGDAKFRYIYGLMSTDGERAETQTAYLQNLDLQEVVGWTGKIMGVTNPAKIMGIAVANISKVKGVA